MAVFSTVFIGIAAFITATAWYYLRYIAPYSKLPCSYTFFPHLMYWVLTGQNIRLKILPSLEEFSMKYAKEGAFATWIGQPVVTIFDPEAIKNLLNEPAAVNKPKIYHVFNFFIRNSVFLSNGEIWKRQKKFLKPAFKFAAVESRNLISNKHSQYLVKKLSSLERNATNDVMHILKDSMLRLIFESILGYDEILTESSIVNKFGELVEKSSAFVVERMLKPWLYPDFSLRIFPAGRKIAKDVDAMVKIIAEIVESKKQNMLNSNKDISDLTPTLFIEILIKEHLQHSSFSMDDLVYQIILFIIAGYDTAAVTLMWCLHLLGHHEEVQERVYWEVQSMNETLCDKDLRNMEYTESVIKETLRMYTTIPLIAKYLNSDLQCGQYTIPKKSNVIIPLFLLHKNSDIFPDPEKFNPERFLKTNYVNFRYFLPFSDGHRPCLGKADAMNQIKIMVAHIIRSFKVVSLDNQEDVELSWEVALHPVNPLRMQFIPRNITSDVI